MIAHAAAAIADTMETASVKSEKDGERFVFIDALRAIAALMVMAYHLIDCTVMAIPLARYMPVFMQIFWSYGMHGVQIFFVISGFVIAHSLRNIEPTGRAIGNFILRRQLRLDPPYWVTIAGILLLRATEGVVLGLHNRGSFSPWVILLNMGYLQNLSGVTEIVGVAWTLCLEIQFYLVFILILAVARKIPGRIAGSKVSVMSVVLVFGLGVVSLALAPRQSDFSLFVPFWFYFAAGVLCYWCLKSGLHPAVFLCFSILISITMWRQQHLATYPTVALHAEWVGLVTALIIFCVGKAGGLTRWLGWPVFLYFGRISYSLYLVHFALVSLVMRIGYKLTKGEIGFALGWVVVAVACSVVTGQLLFTFVEAPSMRLASWVKRRGWAPVAEAQAIVEETGSAVDLKLAT